MHLFLPRQLGKLTFLFRRLSNTHTSSGRIINNLSYLNGGKTSFNCIKIQNVIYMTFYVSCNGERTTKMESIFFLNCFQAKIVRPCPAVRHEPPVSEMQLMKKKKANVFISISTLKQKKRTDFKQIKFIDETKVKVSENIRSEKWHKEKNRVQHFFVSFTKADVQQLFFMKKTKKERQIWHRNASQADSLRIVNKN